MAQVGRERVFTKLRSEVEPRWCSEYCLKFYPDLPVRYRVPLGPIPREMIDKYGLSKAIRMYRPFRPEVDALVIAPDKLILVEAKVHRVMDGISKLPVYRDLVPLTPELAPYKTYPVEMQLLVVKKWEPWTSLCEKYGIRMVDWAPTWVQEYFVRRDLYWTKEQVELRERRKEVLKRLGWTE